MIKSKYHSIASFSLEESLVETDSVLVKLFAPFPRLLGNTTENYAHLRNKMYYKIEILIFTDSGMSATLFRGPRCGRSCAGWRGCPTLCTNVISSTVYPLLVFTVLNKCRESYNFAPLLSFLLDFSFCE